MTKLARKSQTSVLMFGECLRGSYRPEQLVNLESGNKTLSKKGLSFEFLRPPLNGKNCDQVGTPATVRWKRGCVINLEVAALSKSWTDSYVLVRMLVN